MAETRFLLASFAISESVSITISCSAFVVHPGFSLPLISTKQTLQ
jgi:hypothetical protein